MAVGFKRSDAEHFMKQFQKLLFTHLKEAALALSVSPEGLTVHHKLNVSKTRPTKEERSETL